MANNELLKSSIRSVIKANGNEEITGDILQQTLVAIVDALGKGYQFMGEATPATDPGTPDQKVCYLAMQKGVYTNFNNLKVGDYEIVIMMYDSQWQDITITMDKNDVDKVTYAELKALRDSRTLIAGRQYRIIDYITTAVQADTQSAGHPFDIIVVADDEGTLNENAKARKHDGDTYFNDCKLEAWKLKYCLDNDTDRFAWADATNGKGVVWWMKDEWDNECFYDFKNIQYKRYKVKSTQLATSSLVDSCPYLGNANQNSKGLSESITTDFKWVYTFTKYTKTGDLIEDASLVGRISGGTSTRGCYGNKIDALYKYVPKDGGVFVIVLSLNNGVYWTNGYKYTGAINCISNNVMSGCYDFTGLNGVVNTICGNNSHSWSCDTNCHSWTCGTNCHSWSCCIGCHSWSCGNNCNYWACGDYCHSWSCENNCNYWSCGSNCHSWSCGNSCYSWTCGNRCNSWACGNNCYSWTCGNSCYSWSCGNECHSWSCGNECHSWFCGNGVSGTEVLQDYITHFYLDNGVSNITIKSSGTPTEGRPLKNFVVKSGVIGIDSAKLAIVIDTANFPLGSDYQWTIARNSSGTIKQYCEADLIN